MSSWDRHKALQVLSKLQAVASSLTNKVCGEEFIWSLSVLSLILVLPAGCLWAEAYLFLNNSA